MDIKIEKINEKINSWNDKQWEEWKEYLLKNDVKINGVVRNDLYKMWDKEIREKYNDIVNPEKDFSYEDLNEPEWAKNVTELLNNFIKEKEGYEEKI